MRNLIILSVLFFSFSAQAQVLQKIHAYGYEYKRMNVDSTFGIPFGEIPHHTTSDSTRPGALFCVVESGDTAVYFWTGDIWKKVGQDTVYQEGPGINIVNTTISVDTLLISTKANVEQTADSLTNILLPRDLFTDSLISAGDPRYLRKRDSLLVDEPLFSYVVTDTARHIAVRNRTSVWSAVDLMGIEIEPGTPADGSVLTYSQAAGRWMHSISIPMAYAGNVMASYAAYREDKMKKAMEKMFDYILELEKRIQALEKK